MREPLWGAALKRSVAPLLTRLYESKLSCTTLPTVTMSL